LELTDGVVVAAPRIHAEAWEKIAEGHSSKMVVVRIPNDFPADDPRARLVVEKAVGAAANLVLA
jgi:hypothetical protein